MSAIDENIVTTLTPYECAKVVNAKLKVDLPEKKELPSQMFYTYVKKGYIPSTDGLVNLEDLRTWYVKYLEGAKSRMTRENRILPTL